MPEMTENNPERQANLGIRGAFGPLLERERMAQAQEGFSRAGYQAAADTMGTFNQLLDREEIAEAREIYSRFSRKISSKNTALEEAKRDKATLNQYAPVFIVALLQDLLDFTPLGFPGINIVLNICLGLLMFLLLMMLRTNKKLTDSRFLIRGGLRMLFGGLANSIPGISLLPVMVITIGLIYYMDRHLSDEQIEKVLGTLGKLNLRQASRTPRRIPEPTYGLHEQSA